MKEAKTALRKHIARLKAANGCALQQSEAIMAKVEGHPKFRSAKVVLLYHSLKDEVDTHEFVRRWSRSKQILLPVVVGDELELRPYTAPEAMSIGSYGIEEPTGSRFTDYAKIDLIIVPGVAFDLHGNRLGRGKGYYDRLLPHLPHAYRIGVCFPFQLVEEVPAEEFDIRMHEVVTL